MDIQKLMKQAKKMQDELMKQQHELESKSYEASVSGGAVKVILSGKCKLEHVTIEEDLLDKENKEMLEDMILMAVNDVLSKMNLDKEETLGAMTGGAKVPGIF